MDDNEGFNKPVDLSKRFSDDDLPYFASYST